MRRLRITALGLGLAAAIGAAAPLHAQSVKAGIAAWQRGDYSAAVEAWRPLAAKGDVDAAFNLGQAYRLGRGVAIDLAVAQRWFELSARKGHVDAQTTLGLMLFDGGNRTAGLRWLRQAAESGEPRALLVYGTALFNGDGVAPDPVLAYAYVSRAAAQGLEPAKATLADMDRLIPVEQRQKAVAIALDKAGTARPAAKTVSRQAAPATPVASTAKSAAPQPRPGGGWRIQLGAFGKRASAEDLYRRLSGNAALAGRQPVYVPAGAVTRLQVGPFDSRSAAAASCAVLARSGQACFPVEAR